MREVTELTAESGNPIMVAGVSLAHALLAIRIGAPDRAALMVGASQRLQRDYEVNFPPDAFALFGDPGAEAREALGDAAFERARKAGFDLDLRQTIEQMLGFLEEASETG